MKIRGSVRLGLATILRWTSTNTEPEETSTVRMLG